MFGEGGLGGGEAATKTPSPVQIITHCHPELACRQAGVMQWSEGSYFVALISSDIMLINLFGFKIFL